MKINSKKYLIIWLSSAVLLFLGIQQIFGQSQINNDCNLLIHESSSIPQSFWFFTRDDILKSYANLKTNCPPNKADSTVLNSTYLFDHLVDVGLKKLQWKAETIGLTSDPSGLLLQEVYKKSIAASNDDKVNSIPKSLQAEIEALRQSKTPYSHYYNISKAKSFWIYEWSTGLFAKYNALCDLARGLYFNSQVSIVKGGTTTSIIDQKLINCKNQVTSYIQSELNMQDATLSSVQTNVSRKIVESINLNTKNSLDEISETIQKASNDTTDILKKIDQPLQNCNLTDV